MTRPNVSKADEILSHIVETDGWYAGCQTFKGYAKSLESSLTQAQGEVERLRKASKAMLDRYVELVNSGDAGNWNPETEQEVIDCRSALATHPQQGDVG